MKAETVSFTKRKPKEEYGYEEATVMGIVEEGDDLQACMMALKVDVTKVLESEPTDEPAPATRKPKKAKEVEPEAEEEEVEEEEDTEVEAEYLNKLDKNWKSSDKGKAKAKKISQEMEGEEFLDADGEILESFLSTVKKKYGKK